MGTQAIVGVIGILGIVIGAVSQYFLTKFLEEKRHRRNLRTQAYLDYMQCVSEQAQLHSTNDKSALPDIFARTASAKGRVCLYGSQQTIRAFALFEALGANMSTEESRDSYISMVKAMRRDSGNSNKLNAKDIALILFGKKNYLKDTH